MSDRKKFSSSTKFNNLLDAARSGDVKTVDKILSKKKQVDATDTRDLDGRTPLHLAAAFGHNDVIIKLLVKGAEMNAVDRSKKIPLMEACKGYVATCQLLIKHGANVNHKEGRGWTSLHYAAEYGNPEVVKTLLAGNADCNIADATGKTPFHLACQMHPNIVKFMLDKNGDVHKKDLNGWTPLHVAAHYRHIETVELLLTKGADKNAKTIDGKMPRDLTTVPAIVNMLDKK
eukprot:TRINITY_DN7490_c0_g1_i1.p1 TRINITY_DN7490_c0_g1~~TRINITY_DN7490_c0_g1_i1.p1  ORF type:complete len:231 (-),score=35.83 TRINITY_DN7490_c0_g1_i1:81-773(-)